MSILDDKWLEEINDKLAQKNVPPKLRPWAAMTELLKHDSLSSPVVKTILDWFEARYPGSQQIGSLFTGAFFFDTIFWALHVPLVFGTVSVDPYSCLAAPDPIKVKINSQKEIESKFLNLWCDCADYGYSAKVGTQGSGKFSVDLFQSGDMQLRGIVPLLLERVPNPKAIESARMTTEMFLKCFLAVKCGLSESGAKKISHNLERACDQCLDKEDNEDFRVIRNGLAVFPAVGARYSGGTSTPAEL
jgi:hypothetical protein